MSAHKKLFFVHFKASLIAKKSVGSLQIAIFLLFEQIPADYYVLFWWSTFAVTSAISMSQVHNNIERINTIMRFNALSYGN